MLQLEIPEGQSCWKWRKYPIFELSSGHIISLEIDPFASESQSDDSFDHKQEKLFVIDEQFQIWKLEESDEETELYTASERQNLSMTEYRELA